MVPPSLDSNDGWRRLVERADAATTFDELRSAGEQFGKIMGAKTTEGFEK